MSVLRNKNIKINTKINFIENNNYYMVLTNNDLNKLREKVKKQLNINRGIINNYATGFKAKITRETIRKIIYPTGNLNVFDCRYIDDLNAACYLKELFENAVYLDTLRPMKNKSNSLTEKGYHHFVSPLKMNGECYKAYITVREKVNSKKLYVVSVKLFKFNYNLNTISVKKLIDNTCIWNYDLNAYNYYSYSDFVAEGINYGYVWFIS